MSDEDSTEEEADERPTGAGKPSQFSHEEDIEMWKIFQKQITESYKINEKIVMKKIKASILQKKSPAKICARLRYLRLKFRKKKNVSKLMQNTM